MTQAADCKGQQSQKPPPMQTKPKKTSGFRRRRRQYDNVGCWPKISALLTRFLFISHTGFALWRVSQVYGESVLYYLIVGIGCLILETSYTMAVRQGKEYKWYCPSVFFYLLSVVPCIWLLELDTLNTTCANQNNTSPALLSLFFSKLPTSYKSVQNSWNTSSCRHRWSVSDDSTDDQTSFLSSTSPHPKNTVNLQSISIPQHQTSNNKRQDKPRLMVFEPATSDVVFSGDGELLNPAEGQKNRKHVFTTTAQTKLAHVDKTKRTTAGPNLVQSAAIFAETVKNETEKIVGKMDCISPNTWILTLHQTLLFVLVIGRWLLPKGDITRDQLSQLLLVFIAMGADILEFATETLDDEKNACKIATVDILIYAVWTWSLIQFTLVLTASTSRRTRVCYAQEGDLLLVKMDERTFTVGKDGYCTRTIFGNAEVWGILATLIFQDVPFLAFRLYTIIHHSMANQMMIFFTGKNVLVVFLQMYRLCILQMEKKEDIDPPIPDEELAPLRGTLQKIVQSSNVGNRVSDMQVQNALFTTKSNGETIVTLHLEKEGKRNVKRDRAQTR